MLLSGSTWMVVGIDARTTFTAVTGIGRYVLELTRALRELEVDARFWYAARGPVMRATREQQLAQLQPGVPISLSPVSNLLLYSPGALAAWRRWPRLAPYPTVLPPELDLYHAVYWPVPMDRRIPTVLTIHDLVGLRHPEWFLTGHCQDLATIRAMAPRAGWVIADSEHTRQDILDLTRCDPERVVAIPLGVGPEFMAPQSPEQIAAVKDAYSLGRPYLASLSTIEPRKNLPRLIEAYDRVCERENLDLDLVVIGAFGWGDNPITEALVRPRRGRIRALGYVPLKDLPPLLAGAEALGYLSQYEGFGLPPLEAMAANCPVVCSNRTSLPEVVGDAALTVDPADHEAVVDALTRVLTDSALAADLRARGRARAEQFTWRRTAEQTLGVYLRVLEADRRKSRRQAGARSVAGPPLAEPAGLPDGELGD